MDYDGVVETRWIHNYGQVGVQAIADVDSEGSMPAEIPDLFGSAVLSWDRAVSGAAISADGRLHLWCAGEPGTTRNRRLD